ncbi:MAG TPA: hypothetical protein VH370_24215 [Humisphaera sp.]|jgi:hypothetical protein|nr:hypothetical protein [Humisphaera sp.]
MRKGLLSLLVVGAMSSVGLASSAPVTFTQLSGTAAVATGVYQADLSGLGLTTIQSITIKDNSGGSGGSPGQFSGFDLDAIKLSTTNFADATTAAAGVGLAVFDFSPASTFFTAGSQRTPTDPKLFGTDASGTQVDNTKATLGSFDGNSNTTTPQGWISLGDNGTISFNLTAPVSTVGLWLYIGEVGNNGEVAAGNITVSDATTAPTPLPSSVWGGMVLLAIAGIAKYRKLVCARA